MCPGEALPLVRRAADDTLFRRADPALPAVTAATFLRAAWRVAAALPAAPAYLNLCADRCGVAIGVAAAALRGVPCVLAPDRAPAALAALRDRNPGAHAFLDAMPPAGGAAGTIVAPTAADAAVDPFGPVPDAGAIPFDRLVAIGTTSGSTGVPIAHGKGWGALVARSLAAGERFALAGRSIVATVPPGHMYGFETTVLLPLHVAVEVWCGCPFYPADIRAALAAMPGEAVLVTTPVHLAALLAAGGSLPLLAAVISATAPLDGGLAARVEAAWGAPVLEIFGATEVGSIASRRTTATMAWTPYAGIAIKTTTGGTSDGGPDRPSDGAPDAARDGGLDRGPDGGPDGGPEGATVTAPGLPPTALPDRLELQEDGRFLLGGRLADVVKRGGRRASLAGLTAALAALEGVRDAAFWVADPAAEARPLAAAVAPGRDAAALLAELRERIDPVFLPRRIQLLDALPRDATGKLPRDALLALDGAAPVSLGSFAIAADHPCFAGHFPGHPVLPGALLLAEIAALVEAARPGWRVAGVVQAKFLCPVRPGQAVAVGVAAAGTDRLAFTCRVTDRIVVQGLLSLDRVKSGSEDLLSRIAGKGAAGAERGRVRAKGKPPTQPGTITPSAHTLSQHPPPRRPLRINGDHPPAPTPGFPA